MAEHEAGSRVRNASPSEQDPTSRNKRRKYTGVACSECRRRKLKCLPSDVEGCCQRCKDGGIEACAYQMRRPLASQDGPSEQGHELVASLSQDVKILRDTMTSWMSMARPSHDKPDQQKPPSAAPSPLRPRPSPRAVCDAPREDAFTTSASTSTPSVRTESTRAIEHPPTGRNVPEEPRFVGPMRSAYSIQVGDRVLSQMGIPQVEEMPTSGMVTAVGSPSSQSVEPEKGFWELCDPPEFERLVVVFQEEVGSVYPCIDSNDLLGHAGDIIDLAKQDEDVIAKEQNEKEEPPRVSLKDVQLAKVIVATAMTIEGQGRSADGAAMIESIQKSVFNVVGPIRDLQDLQLLILLSIYYFHTDKDLLAWRTVGLAAREALVIGLHRKSTLQETFPDEKLQYLAVRVFWTIFVLDRRWSFGTSLSFALVDGDIDANLPEPGESCAYLQCMVGYGRLCSSLWGALVPFSQRNVKDPEQVTTGLDIETQEWLESIPAHLRLRHPRLRLAAQPQPSVLQRLRALLYLRGNHSRILIYRYYLLGTNRIKTFHENASLAVDIAQDSIQVLVHLNETSDIYRRQQAAFNYFLLSAIAVIFLAVCNDPETFAAPCKKSLHSAIDLLKHFSRHSHGSRRLWSSVRGILPRLRKLEIRRTSDGLAVQNPVPSSYRAVDEPSDVMPINTDHLQSPMARGDQSRDPYANRLYGHGDFSSNALGAAAESAFNAQSTATSATPDFATMSNELIGLFETFEQGQHCFVQENEGDSSFWQDRLHAPNLMAPEQVDLLWQFNWLIQ